MAKEFVLPDRDRDEFMQAKEMMCRKCFYKNTEICQTCPVSKSTTVYNKDINRITVRNGIDQGLIRFDRPYPVGVGTACWIGDKWFYFGDDKSELAPRAYIQQTTNESRVDWVYKALMAFKQMHDPLYRYIIWYLIENFDKNNKEDK